MQKWTKAPTLTPQQLAEYQAIDRENFIRPGVEGMIEYLNSLLELDRKAISKLFLDGSAEANISDKSPLLDHQTLQVGMNAKGNRIRVLGLLNGYFGVYKTGKQKGAGPIACYATTDAFGGVDIEHAGIHFFVRTLALDS